jgi:hypothetical protein
MLEHMVRGNITHRRPDATQDPYVDRERSLSARRDRWFRVPGGGATVFLGVFGLWHTGVLVPAWGNGPEDVSILQERWRLRPVVLIADRGSGRQWALPMTRGPMARVRHPVPRLGRRTAGRAATRKH